MRKEKGEVLEKKQKIFPFFGIAFRGKTEQERKRQGFFIYNS